MRFCNSLLAGKSGRVSLSLITGLLAFLVSQTSSYALLPTVLNVTNFGAAGDAVWFYANTSSNSALVTTTNQLSSADIGKVIELFGAGPLGTTNIHQDFLGIITNVVNGTNVYMSRVAGATTNGCQGVYGTDNTIPFQNCINYAPSNAIITIPDGTYFIPGTDPLDSNYIQPGISGYHPSLIVTNGGITLSGQSENGTVLLGNGAWQIKGGYSFRGGMFGIDGIAHNNGPIIFDTMTLDGGVQTGCTTNGHWPASTANGDGWDTTHHAVMDSGIGPFPKLQIFRNLHVKRWRGEQFISFAPWDCPPPGPAIVITNCTFSDGDASALNLWYSQLIENCVFSNLFMVQEFTETKTRNVSVMQNCLATNIFGWMISVNGANTNSVCPTYTIQNNTFYYNFGVPGIMIDQGRNVVISNNNFISPNGSGVGVYLGAAGAQGNSVVSNVLIVDNLFTNLGNAIVAYGFSTSSMIQSNRMYGRGTGSSFISCFGAQTNIWMYNNWATNIQYAVRPGKGQFPLDDVSDNFPFTQVLDYSTNATVVSYGSGCRQSLAGNNTAKFYLNSVEGSRIPPGAQLVISNEVRATVPLYTSAALTDSPMMMTNGQTINFQWTNGVWVDVSTVADPLTASLSAPANGSTVSGTVTLTASTSGGTGGVAGVSFLVNGTVVGTASTSPYTLNWNSTSVADGTYTINARASDNLGNQATSSGVTVTVANPVSDTTPPSASVSSPANGSTVSNTVTIAVNATDNTGGSGMSNVVFLVDGNVVGTDISSPYTFSWNSPNVANGNHTLSARATDNAGNAATSAGVSVTVANPVSDTTAPSVSVTAPANSSTISNAVTITASATDNTGGSGVASVAFYVDSALVGSDATSPYSLTWNSTGVGNGSHTLSARATDNAGNQATSAGVSVTVANASPDNTSPSVNVSSPLNGTTVSNTVTITVNATDNSGGSGVASVAFFVDGVQVGSDTTSPYSFAWNSAGVGNGSHTFSARATDNAGNQATSTGINVTVANQLPDTTPPAVNMISPTGGLTVSNTVTLSASATDDTGGSGVASISFLVDGSVVGSDTSSPYTFNWNTTGVGNGNHTVSARATDHAGNQATSAGITVTVANGVPDPLAPTVVLLSPTPDATVSGTITLSAMARARNFRSRVTNVVFMVDGAVMGSVHGRRLVRMIWDSTRIPDGTHTFTAKALNRRGRQATSPEVTVTVQNANGITTPTNTAPTNLRVVQNF